MGKELHGRDGVISGDRDVSWKIDRYLKLTVWRGTGVMEQSGRGMHQKRRRWSEKAGSNQLFDLLLRSRYSN